MISSSQLTLSQSKTTIAKMPPPTPTPTTRETKTARKTAQRTANNNRQTQQDQHQESKDDWVINDNDNMNKSNDINIMVPSFIRLFVIRRIIDKYIKNNKKKKKKETKEETIKELANVFTYDKKIESLVINIVTRLINNGIKKYMSKYYEERAQANIIEDIFDKMILEKFCQEYNEMINYGINKEIKNNNYCQHLLFNSSDLMSQIFQCLEWGIQFDEDLYSCSLVSSHWLYHVWNVNSVYHINFSKLILVREDDSENNRKWTRMWQRLYNVKSMQIKFNVKYSKAVLATVNKLSMFRKIEKVNVDVHVREQNEVEKYISCLIPILSRCKDRINDCRIWIKHHGFDSSDFEAPSPLRLPKAQYFEIRDSLFYRQWTNECRQLKLAWFKNINKDWCKFVIENCDCSNINNLILNGVTFDYISINKVILNQFALKFCNLKTFEIEIDGKIDNNVLLFWQLLEATISKNKTKVKLKVVNLKRDQYNLLSKRMADKDLKIDKFIIGGVFSSHAVDHVKKFIQERENRGLNHLAIDNVIFESGGKKLLDELKCKSINTFELKCRNFKFVNSLLEWKMIVEKQIFVIIDVCKNHIDSDLPLFKQLCENVYQLFLQQIALDIKIKIKHVLDSKMFESLYSSYFENTQFLSKYNSPNCNKNILRLPREKPYTYFYINDSKKAEWQRYFVFGATNVQIK